MLFRSPSNVIEELGDDVRFANAMVWFGAEYVAWSVTQGEYIEETEVTL